MSKINAEHLARSAYVYIRQSTADQLVHNHESRRRQYGLADRARQLGWTTVEVVDDDLGRSGGGTTRPGFERLIAAICAGGVGAVLAIEVSRLARNGRDWHTLIEFCGLVGTIIVDEDGIYDPRHPNDRLLLGMKGTMSELELSLFRQRSQEALKQKARRGALFLRVAAGYVKAGRDRIEKDPNQRVQEALKLVFAKFADFQSARRAAEDIHSGELAFQDRFRFALEPFLDNSRVDLTKVGVVSQIAVLQIVQAGKLANQARLNRCASHEHRSGGTVIRPRARVFFDAAAEFTEAHQRNTIRLPQMIDVVQKCLYGISQLTQQAGMRIRLLGVCIKAVQSHVVHGCLQT